MALRRPLFWWCSVCSFFWHQFGDPRALQVAVPVCSSDHLYQWNTVPSTAAKHASNEFARIYFCMWIFSMRRGGRVCHVCDNRCHVVILFLGCTTSRGLPSDLFSTCLVCFASAACRPAYILARTCSVRMVTFVVDRKRDEDSDIRDELEMLSAFKSFHLFFFSVAVITRCVCG